MLTFPDDGIGVENAASPSFLQSFFRYFICSIHVPKVPINVRIALAGSSQRLGVVHDGSVIRFEFLSATRPVKKNG